MSLPMWLGRGHRGADAGRGLLLGLLMVLAACGTFEVGLVPTPTATPSILRYENTAYGFAFTYPSGWILEETAHVVTLRQGTLALRVGFKRVDEAEEIGATPGQPSEGTVYVQKLTFLGQTMPGEALISNRKVKAVTYQPARPVTTDDLVFAISLTDTAGSDGLERYEAIDLSDAVLEEVGTILESFERIPAEVTGSPGDGASPAARALPARPTPVPGWATYVSAAYGFSFAYPPTWELAQVAGGEMTPFGPSADAVRLTQGDSMLTIQVRRTGEAAYLGSGEPVAGALVQAGPVQFMGAATNLQLLILRDEVRQMSLRHRGRQLDFYVMLGPTAGPGLADETFALPEAIRSEVEAILGSFAPYP